MTYRFLRHLRQGAATLIAQREGDANASARPPITLAAQLEHTVWSDPAAPAARTPLRLPGPALQLNGPGDAVAIDRRQVLRQWPQPDALDVDPDRLCSVEFKHPGLPWLLTPFAPGAGTDRLRPWIALVVVPRDLATFTPGSPLPRLALSSSDELPPPDQLHAWAHVQVSGVGPEEDVAALLSRDPGRAISRLLCPRRLAPRTRYLACVVPTFAAGRQAGLGMPVSAAGALAPSWQGSAAVELPVYVHWEFTTGAGQGFEALVRRLLPRPELSTIGTRPLDVSNPRAGIPPSAVPVTLDLDGALGAVNPSPRPPVPAGLRQAITDRMDQADLVGPPRYGRWHAAAPRGATGPVWLETLNSDPVRRVAAALGARVVQQQQEALMAACWEQFGEILRANQALRQGELATVASAVIYARRVLPLVTDGTVFAFAVPTAARTRVHPALTLRGLTRTSCMPPAALSGAFRKALRPTGPVGRRMLRVNDVPLRAGAMIAELMRGNACTLPRPRPQAALLPPTWSQGATPDPLPGLSGTLRARLRAATAVAGTLAQRAQQPACLPLDPDVVASRLTVSLDPRVTVPRRVRAQIEIPAALRGPGNRIDPVMAAPRIDTPMVRPLLELGTAWVMPGVDGVPPESVVAVAANRAFIEAYMVGLNHEMARELLWRGFPTDQRGTVFTRFWDTTATAGRVNPPSRDIAPLHTWPTASALGSHADGSGTLSQLVLVLRGEIVRRFPNATMFLQKARAGAGTRTPNAMIGGPSSEFPVFRGELGPDLVYLGFRIAPEVARGGTPAAPNGYFLVIQEQPRELGFGFSSSDGRAAAEDVSQWRGWADIVWESLPLAAGDHIDLVALETEGFGGAAQSLPSLLQFEPHWALTSDVIAAIALRRPFRLSIHVSEVMA